MSDHRTPDEKELERIETELLTVQLCLEILTGVCANLPEWDGQDASKQSERFILTDTHKCLCKVPTVL